MLSEMVLRRGAIRRMFTHVMSGAEHREPSSRDWAIGERIATVLDRPCKIVTKSQDKGHWLLSNAVDSICRLFVAVGHMLLWLYCVIRGIVEEKFFIG